MLYLEKAREHFSSARSNIGDSDDVECDFYRRLALMIPDVIDVDSLILAFKIMFNDANKKNTESFIACVPKYVEQCASKEFAHEFRKKYIVEVLGLDYWEFDDVDYGCIEVEEDIIDISNKDRGEVLAMLYNASIPMGRGFESYNPLTLTKEMGEIFFDKFGDKSNDGKTVNFDYILGRPIKCSFSENTVNVRGYNNTNQDGLAQRAISACPNIDAKVKRIK